ncbi:hypothetical protein EIK77_004711 [Talaromyces pinophilus]|jgi:hypothetical protein|nr:hypothetical protein EIK77_004711 [Talaromyces pinophilus]
MKQRQLSKDRSEVELEQITAHARVGSPVVVGKQVRSSTGNVARRASSRFAGRVSRADGEAHGGELGVVTHVDAGEIPPDSGVLVGVLVLEDVGLLRSERDLDGDAAAVGVGAPVLGVGLAAVEGDHVAGDVGHGPEVDGLFHVVDDLDSVAGDVGALLAGHQLAVLGVSMVAHVVAVVDSREGSCNGAEGSEKSEGLGEHFVLIWRLFKTKSVLIFGLKECIQSFQKTV